jgi:hypothetical protein
MWTALLGAAGSIFGPGGAGGSAPAGPSEATGGTGTIGGVTFGNKNLGEGSGNTAGAFGSAGKLSGLPPWVWTAGGLVLLLGLVALWPRARRK